MKKILILAMVIGLLMSGCAEMAWNQKMQQGYFDQNGKKAGMSGSLPCIRQAMKEIHPNVIERSFSTCGVNPQCAALAEACMKEKGYIEAKTFETTEERMALYQKAYEEGWIKTGMTRLEVINLIGAPQIASVQLIPPRKIWMYCRSAAKTAFIGFNFVLLITWNDDKVESVNRTFKI